MMNKYGKINWIKKISRIVMILILSILMLVGCQLADKDAVIKQSEDEDITNKDIFCGVFLSTKDFFFDDDIDLSAEDIEKALSGEEIQYDSSENENNKIYAKKVEKVDENGATHIEYNFEGYEGIQIFRYYVMEENGEISYASDATDDAVDSMLTLNKTDEGSNDKIEATVNVNEEYVTQYRESEDAFIIRVNKVYQTRDGKVYMIPGEYNYDLSIGQLKVSLADKSNIKTDGEEQEYNFEVDVTINQIKPVDKTILRQMNSENELIESTEIDNSAIPEKVEINNKAEYIIIEKYANGKINSREMIETKTEDDEELSIDLPVKDEEDVFINVATVELKNK